MKIKTKIYLITLTALAFVLVVAATVLVTARQVNLALEENEVANNIISGLFEMGVLTTDYVLHNSERAKTQWEIKHAAINRLLHDTEFQIRKEQAVLERIRRNHADARTVFDELAAARRRELAAELTQRFVGQLDVRTQTIVGDATYLARASATRVKELRRRANIVVVSSVATIALFLLGVCWLFDRGVARPIRRLHEGTEIISSGNLDYKVGTPARDEVGQLARAFDRMTEVLAGQMGALQESEERYRLVLDNMLEGCQIIGFDWRFLYVNEAMARHGRQTKEALLGHTMMELYPGIENTGVFAVLRRCMDERTSQRMENEFIFPDGSRGCFELSIQPVPEGIFILSIETTEHKRAEEEIRALNANLENRIAERTSQLQKVNLELENATRAKSTFLATMSHELRTPMNAIIGFTGTLLMGLPGPLTADQEKQLRTVQASAKHLLALINDLLDLAKIEAGKVELKLVPTDCKAVVEEVAAILRPQAEGKGLALQVTLPDQALTISADRRALSQIIINLANNAIKFTERGGVHLKLSPGEINGKRMVEFSVEDTGIGIRPEDQVKLFAAFTQVDVQTRRNREGSGLGLHLSQKLAELLGGKITFRSEYGKGSTFTLALAEA